MVNLKDKEKTTKGTGQLKKKSNKLPVKTSAAILMQINPIVMFSIANRGFFSQWHSKASTSLNLNPIFLVQSGLYQCLQ